MDTTHVEGEEVYLHVQVKGHPTPSLNWYHDGVVVRADYAREIDGDGGLLFPCIEVAHSGVYTYTYAYESICIMQVIVTIASVYIVFCLISQCDIIVLS